jgi:hypothetical protein
MVKKENSPDCAHYVTQGILAQKYGVFCSAPVILLLQKHEWRKKNSKKCGKQKIF